MQIQLDSLKNRKILAGAILFIFLIIVSIIFLFSSLSGNNPYSKQKFYIPTIGYLGTFDGAMDQNQLIAQRVAQILSYDEVYLFVNYREINGAIAEILFFWSGLTPESLKTMKAEELIDNFVRRVYDVPVNEPVRNNPLLGSDPWPTILSRFKSRLLMQGNAYKIYDGLAYYDSKQDKIIVEGKLSKDYVRGFSKFVLTQEKKQQKRYINNFLSFVYQTKGLENLSDEEKSMLQVLGSE